MDGFGVRMYNIDRRSFLQYFERLRGKNNGGIYVLDHDFFRIGFSPEALTRISYPNGTLAVDPDKPFWWDGEPAAYQMPENWPTPYIAGLMREGNEMAEALIEAQKERAAVRWDSVGGFLDWLTLGIVSGVWDGICLRHNAMTDDPSVYNVINAISLGTLDTLRGVVKPEKPWSLEHLLDIVGTVLIAYAAFRTVSKVTRAVGGVGAAQSVPLTRTQIDEILGAPDGHRLFAPNKEITRQEMFTLLYNALKVIGRLPEGNSGNTLTAFSDEGQIASWATEAMTLLVESGTVSGNDGKLSPTGLTTRAEMAQVLYKLLSK